MTREGFASWLTNKLIRSGDLEPHPCECCARPVHEPRVRRRRVQAHHDDYRFPLVIRWLCASCHRSWHFANGPGKHRDEIHDSPDSETAPKPAKGGAVQSKAVGE